MRIAIRWLSLAAAALAAASCATQGARDVTLYEELGGQPGVESIVAEMLLNVADDERIASDFAESNVPRLRRLLIEQFCQVSDGPCKYTGYSMKESHRGMVVTETEFNAVVEALVDAMDSLHVATTTQNRLLARLAPLQSDIVYQ
jgi:hemoglobin